MDFLLWILLCLLASVGVVQVLGWVYCRILRPPRHKPGYHLAVIDTFDAQEIESQLRYQLALLRWGGCSGVLLIVSEEYQQEAQTICKKLLRTGDPVLLCRPDELPGMIGSVSVLVKKS